MLDLRNLNTYDSPDLEKVAVWRNEYIVKGKNSRPSCIVAQSFGASIEDQSVNMILWETVFAARHLFGNLPIFAQAEVASFLPEKWTVATIGAAHVESSVAFSKYSSREVLQMALEKGAQKDAVLVTHPALMHRMEMLWKELAGEPAGLLMPKNPDWSYDDSQLWVRGKWQWTCREFMTRALMFARETVPTDIAEKIPVIKSV